MGEQERIMPGDRLFSQLATITTVTYAITFLKITWYFIFLLDD